MLTLSGAGQPQNGGAGIEERFVISVKTDINGGSADNQFTVPTRFGGYNYTIETSDGQTINNVTGNYTITFPSPGIYDIMISGDFPWYRGVYSPDPGKLIDIKNWGTNPWLSFEGSFNGAFLTIITAADIPNLESVESMGNMFSNTAYNLQSIPNIENWNVSNVTSTRGMFSQSSIIINPQFPIDLSSWDVSSVADMSYMFYTVQQPTVLTFDLSNWDISNVTASTNLFRTGGFASAALYNNTLISWALQNVNNNLNVNFGNSQYTYEAAAARQTLIDTYGWTITDGGQAVSPEFVIQVKTDNTGTSNDDQFTLPWTGTYDVDWGDGVVETGLVNAQTHTYASAGTYDVSVTATTGRIRFNNGGDKSKLLDIKNWGTCQWVNMDRAFMGCSSLTDVSVIDTPDFSNLIDLGLMFYTATQLTSIDVSNWDVSNVEQFDNMFVNCDITSLNVSNWDVSNATNLYAFVQACNLLTTLDISNWNVGNCSNFKFMFSGCILLNPDVSNWDISSMTGLRSMFSNADSFDRSLANWGVIPFASNEWNNFMFKADGLSIANYDATLITWAALTQTSNININFGGSQYTLGGAAEVARNTLINTYGWTITDGGGIFVGVLDTYPGAAAAYSLRGLASASLGSAVVRVRRSSDNTEQDFTSTEIIDGTLATFCSGTDGFVTTWYDQSGNNNNAAQATAANQPKLVSSGVVELSNNKPSLRFKQSNSRHLNQPLINELSSSFSVLSVVQGETASTAYEGIFATGTMMQLARVGGGNWGTYPNGITNTNLYTSTINLITMISSNGNAGDFYTNNNSDGSFTNTEGQGRRGVGGVWTQEFNGYISEMIIYPSDQSTNRTGIETNINNEYTIY